MYSGIITIAASAEPVIVSQCCVIVMYQEVLILHQVVSQVSYTFFYDDIVVMHITNIIIGPSHYYSVVI